MATWSKSPAKSETAPSCGLTSDDGGPKGMYALGELRIRPAGAGCGLRKGPRVGGSGRGGARGRPRMR